jgi:EAL domain-containing protein (putative c-di-GMP-specific phosphodiesterase class I)
MAKRWVLEGYWGSNEDALQRMPLKQLPAKVGRDPGLSLAIVRSEISRIHAEFFEKGGELFIRDFGSTNGTFVNHQALAGETSLRHGDVIHFASYEVRVLEEFDEDVADATPTTMKAVPFANKLPTGLHDLQVLLNNRAVRAEYQPIVSVDGILFGYEILGRGKSTALPVSPMELFRIAESMPGKDAELSILMRDVGVREGYLQSKTIRLFMNTHPAEMKNIDHLLMNMRQLRESCHDLPMVLEIHEDAVTDVGLMKKMATELLALDVELAYDDFGAGQARLMEMIEVPVKYVKFDIALIRGLHKAPVVKQKMVAALVAMTRDMGIQALAEGVEGPEELALCRQMNFDLIQGYHFSKPKPLMDYINPLP